MRKFTIVLAAALFLGGATPADAQTTAGVSPAPGRISISANGAFQVSKQDFTRSTSFPIYDEEAQIEVAQNDIEGGGVLDVGAAYRFTRTLGLGASYTFLRSVGGGDVNASIPHPQVYDQPRTLTGSATDLEHKEQAVHVYATWLIPASEKVDLTLSAGPSFFNITQDFIQSVAFGETPPFSTVTLDELSVVSLRQNAVGFNVGVDATYAVTRRLGVGALARYTGAKKTFDLGEGNNAEVKAGGFQIGGGVRVRF